jgi:hypothetical protein
MAEASKIVIHQSLHGYSEGHSLLASSIELSLEERKQLLVMSDWSGTGVEKGFSSYITAYPLAGNKYYALAKTWYADEMGRPGCVWTHTLLIEVTLLGGLKDLELLTSLFERPTVNNYSVYCLPISISALLNRNSSLQSKDESFYIYSYQLYENFDKQILIPSSNSSKLESVVFSIWNQQWPRLRRSFSFCTGSLAVRLINDKPLDLQIIPEARKRQISNFKWENILILEDQEIEVKKPWLALYKQLSHNQLLSFMYRYGSDVMGHRSRFVSLIFAFEKKASGWTNSSLVDIVQFFDDYFPDSKEARVLKKETITNKLVTPESKVELLLLLAENKHSSISGIEWNEIELFKELINSKYLRTADIGKLLEKFRSILSDEEIINIISSMPIEAWIKKDWVTNNFLDQLLRINPKLSENPILWKSDPIVLDKWINALVNIYTPETIIPLLLKFGNSEVFDKAIKSYDNISLQLILDWVLVNKELPIHLKKYIQQAPTEFFQWVTVQEKLNDFIADLVDQLFLPTDWGLSSVEYPIWERLVDRTLMSDEKNTKLSFLTFIFNASVLNKLKSSNLIISLVFQPLHEILKSDHRFHKSWYRFLNSIDSNFYNVNQIKYFNWLIHNKKTRVPDWDKCEILRRCYINAFIKYRWEERLFIESISNIKLFEKAIIFGISSFEGYAFIQRLYFFLNEKYSKDNFDKLSVIEEVLYNEKGRNF